jgi:hypothetical protein
MNKHMQHSVITPCSTLSTAWQLEYRSLKSDNGFIGNIVGSCDEVGMI